MTIPQPAWAIVLAFMGVALAACCLFYRSAENTVTLQVLTIAASLVSGALGAFAGAASSKADVKTSAPLTINQNETKES